MKNQAKLLEIFVKWWKKNSIKETIFRTKTGRVRHVDHLHPVFITNEQIIFQKIAGAVPMPVIDPNCSNKIILQTIGMMGKKKEIGPIQDPYQPLKTP